jgi:type I restriction enzyme R subunit
LTSSKVSPVTRATLKLSDEKLALYDALETNDSVVQVLGDKTLRIVAREVADAVRKNATIDWTVRENGSTPGDR